MTYLTLETIATQAEIDSEPLRDNFTAIENLLNGTTALDVEINGSVTATSFVGDGSGITGITVTGTGVPYNYLGTSVTDATISTGTTINGEYEYNNLTLSGTTALTVGDSGWAIIRVKGTLTIDGTITVNGKGKNVQTPSFIHQFITNTETGSWSSLKSTGANAVNIYTPNAVVPGGTGGDGGGGNYYTNAPQTPTIGGKGSKSIVGSYGFGNVSTTVTDNLKNAVKAMSLVVMGGVGGWGGGGGGALLSAGSSWGGAGSANGGLANAGGGSNPGTGGVGYASGGAGGACYGVALGKVGGDGSQTISYGGGSVLIVCNVLKVLSGSLSIDCSGLDGVAGGNAPTVSAGARGGGGGGGSGGGGGGMAVFYTYSLYSGTNISSVTVTANGGAGGAGGTGGINTSEPAHEYDGVDGSAGSAGVNGYALKTVAGA